MKELVKYIYILCVCVCIYRYIYTHTHTKVLLSLKRYGQLLSFVALVCKLNHQSPHGFRIKCNAYISAVKPFIVDPPLACDIY